MTTHISIRSAVRRALLMGTAAASAATMQVQAADDTIQEIVVTGSRISVPNMQSISPVTAISAEDISATGKVRVEDILNQMPQAFAAQGSTISNGSNGTATVDLRGLGAKRTLVLVNGRRMMPGNPDAAANYNGAGAADLNQIPKQLIERVEVLTGGASSVYGADAVGGVVNFILNTRFEGVKVEAELQLLPAQERQRRSRHRACRQLRSARQQREHGLLQGLRVRHGLELRGRSGQRDVLRYLHRYRRDPAAGLRLQRLYVQLGRGIHLRRFAHGMARARAAQGSGERRPRRGFLHRCRDRRDATDDRYRRLQLRPAELLPAAGRALHGRRVPEPGRQPTAIPRTPSSCS